MEIRKKHLQKTAILSLLVFSGLSHAGFTDKTNELIPSLVGDEPAKAAWGDFNNDGYPDLLAGKTLYKNDAGNGFTAVATDLAPGIWGDYDNDGFLDIYLYTQRRLKRNIDGSGNFETIAVPMPEGGNRARAALWADVNNDGWLDLYVPGFEDHNKNLCYADYILMNQQGQGFEMESQPNYINVHSCRRSRGVTAADFDRDGDQDIYLSNYRLQPNTLWENISAASGQWEESADEYNVDDGKDPSESSQWKTSGGHTIGSSWGDFDNDGWLDLMVGHFAHSFNPKALILKNNGVNKRFTLQERFTHNMYQESYANPALGDFNNDGFLDLFFTTVYSGDAARLYQNNGNFNFVNATSSNSLGGVTKTYQAAWADFDNDGDLDLVTGGKFYVNNGNSENHWLKIKLIGDGYNINTHAIGSQVRVYSDSKVITRQVEGATGEGNQNELKLHFGLGSNNGPVDIEVLWPDGTEEVFSGITVDQTIVLPEGETFPEGKSNIAAWLIPVLFVLL